jgi:hypothetical protein
MKRIRPVLLGTILAAAAMVSSCGNSSSSSCVETGKPVGVVIDIACAKPSTRPFYVWDSLTQASILEVDRTSDDSVAWLVRADEGSLPEPIRQGEIPVGVSLLDGSEFELTAGVEYRVTLYSDQPTLLGQRTFTILP